MDFLTVDAPSFTIILGKLTRIRNSGFVQAKGVLGGFVSQYIDSDSFLGSTRYNSHLLPSKRNNSLFQPTAPVLRRFEETSAFFQTKSACPSGQFSSWKNNSSDEIWLQRWNHRITNPYFLYLDESYHLKRIKKLEKLSANFIEFLVVKTASF